MAAWRWRRVMLEVATLVLASSTLVSASSGLWPHPRNRTDDGRTLYLNTHKFHFKAIGFKSDILHRAFERYGDLIFKTPGYRTRDSAKQYRRATSLKGAIKQLRVLVDSPDQSLNLGMDETYTLHVDAPKSVLQAATIFGALRGLETFSQLVERVDMEEEEVRASSGSPSWSWSAELHGSVSRTGDLQHRVLLEEGGDGSIYQPTTSIEDVEDGDVDEGLPPIKIALAVDAGAGGGFEQGASGVKGRVLENQSRERLLAVKSAGRHPKRATAGAGAFESVVSMPHKNELPSLLQQPAGEAIDPGPAREEGFEVGAGSGVGVGIVVERAPERDVRGRHNRLQRHHKKHRRKVLYTVPGTLIEDGPRFAHRGVLIDSARHFLSIEIIEDMLDAMAWAKMNVLHWHIVDDQSFPYESEALPLFSLYGAFSPRHTYSRGDVDHIIEYARDRGIRVIPEFDTPGHTQSWGQGYPDLLTECFDESGKKTEERGPLNPARNETFQALWALLQEVAGHFPDTFLHLGGDEVPFDCWKSNPEVQELMAREGFTTPHQVEQYFEERVLQMAAVAGRSYIIWQDVLDNDVKVANDTVVHVWKWWQDKSTADHMEAEGLTSHGGTSSRCSLSRGCPPQLLESDIPSWVPELERITKQGYRALLSAPWYLNLGTLAKEDWPDYYAVDPHNFTSSQDAKELVIGGEACLWGEFIDGSNLIQTAWPRAAAIAERLWSPPDFRDVESARPRFETHRCRMLARGYFPSAWDRPRLLPARLSPVRCTCCDT
eukprot:jgi/Botrbrau1/17269/Bobra.0015s0027.1